MARNLTNLFISESFQYLLQESGSAVQNGLGVDVSFLDVSASHAVTASFLTGTIESASFSDTSVSASYALSASYAVSASHEIVKEISSSYADRAGVAESVAFDDITGKPTLLSSSAQIATDISGAFDDVSSSLATRITAQEDFSSSLDATFATDAELNAVSSSVATDITNIVDGTTVVASSSFAQTASVLIGSIESASYAISSSHADFADTVFYEGVLGKPTLLSGSAQIATEISGAFTLTSQSLAADITTVSNDLDSLEAKSLVSSSAQIATEISGAFTDASASLASDITNIENGTTTVQYASNTVVVGKNLSGGLLQKGIPVYITGSGTEGNIAGIYPADASNPNRRPAGAILGEALNDGEEGVLLLDGFINEVDTSGFESGDKIFLAVGGGYTNVEPTGSSNIVQFLGNVEKKDATNGSGVIQMMGEGRNLPNIPQGELIVGGTGDVYTTIASSSFAKVGEDNTFTGTQTFDNIAVNGTGSFAVIQSVTGSAKIVGDAFIILNNNLPAERYAGVAVIDSGSGSPNVTASYQYDGQSNDWFYEYTDDGGVTTEHGIAIFGPEYDTIGNPTYLTSGSIPKADGGHHLYDSIISDNGTTVTVAGDITGDVITANTNFAGNLTGNVTGNASTATTASYATTALSASFADNATSSSFASSATSASFADTSTSSSYAVSSSYSVSSSISDANKNYNSSSGSIEFWSGNQTEYNAISASADVNTIYFVVE